MKKLKENFLSVWNDISTLKRITDFFHFLVFLFLVVIFLYGFFVGFSVSDFFSSFCFGFLFTLLVFLIIFEARHDFLHREKAAEDFAKSVSERVLNKIDELQRGDKQ